MQPARASLWLRPDVGTRGIGEVTNRVAHGPTPVSAPPWERKSPGITREGCRRRTWTAPNPSSPALGPRGRRHPRLLPRARRRPGRGVEERDTPVGTPMEAIGELEN